SLAWPDRVSVRGAKLSCLAFRAWPDELSAGRSHRRRLLGDLVACRRIWAEVLRGDLESSVRELCLCDCRAGRDHAASLQHGARWKAAALACTCKSATEGSHGGAHAGGGDHACTWRHDGEQPPIARFDGQ